MKDLRHELEKFKEQASLGEARSFLASAKTVGELKVITAQRDGMDAAAMRKQGDFLRDKEPGVVGVLASVIGIYTVTVPDRSLFSSAVSLV